MYRYPFLVIFISIVLISCSERSEMPTIYLSASVDLDFDHKKAILLRQVNGLDTIDVAGTAKRRGGWSRQFAKKSFSLDTEFPISLAGMPSHTKWILNASYIDKTLIRHRFWYELWLSMDMDHQAAASRYVQLFVDKKYQGIYIAMERIHESRLQVGTDGVLFKDPQVFRKDTIPAEKEDSYFHQKYPDPKTKNKDSLLFSFRDFLMTSDSASFVCQIDHWVDLNNIIDWHLLLLLSHNGDGLLKNFYLYKNSEDDQLKVVPWDYDHSAGRDGDNELNLSNTMMDDDRNVLLDRLMMLNGRNYNDRRCDRWWELRSSSIFTPKNINHRINKLEIELTSEIDNNFNKWPYDGPGYYDQNDHLQEVQLMKDYLMNRITYLDQYFDCQIQNKNK